MLQLNEDVPLWQKALFHAGYIALWPLIQFVKRSHTKRNLRRGGYIRTRPKPHFLKPRGRGRSLTLTGSSGNKAPTVQAGLLLQLPRELRDIIWREVVAGKVVHWIVVDRKLVGFPCRANDPASLAGSGHLKCWSRVEVENEEIPRIGVLGLVSSCRQIYTETIDLLYTENTFDVLDNDAMLFLPRLLLPQRVNTITSLRFSWRLRSPPSTLPPSHWMQDQRKAAKRNKKSNDYREAWFTTWNNLSRMEGLRKLTLELNILFSRAAEWTVEELDIVKSVTVPGTLNLVLKGGMAQRMIGNVGASNCCVVDGDSVAYTW
ncbi:hypothetical protein BKA65DRAFT_506003 [Rhexocercosporidium sp. MPI-PUGE-AT-0058]|nr:hypothetical protein BKA65DRAFT_506003 [Rhexocercosporidium sp. MPI-PUGE-AT-0058]